MELQFHSLKYSTEDIIYHMDSISFLRVNREEKTLIQQAELKWDPFEDKKDVSIDIPKYNEMCLQLLKKIDKKTVETHSQRESNTKNKPFLSKLILLISHGCNLRCSYCSLHHLNEEKISMTRETACQAIKSILNKYEGNVRTIMFFGGEPLLNYQLIQQVVNYTQGYCDKHNYKVPSFGIQTNGTLISKEIALFLKENSFTITISLDGPPEVNDLQRALYNGSGSHGKIIKGISNLIENDVQFSIEATITRNHLEIKDPVKSIFHYLIGLGAQSVHIMPVMGSYGNTELPSEKTEEIAKEFAQIAACSIKSLLTDSPKRLFQPLYVIDNLLYPNKYICYAGLGTVTIDAKGNIYPCYYLSKDDYYMGNVFDETSSSDSYQKIQNYLLDRSKNTIYPCKNCWAKNLCNSCYGAMNADKEGLTAPSPELCIIIREIIDSV